MQTISTFFALTSGIAVLGLLLLGRLDYRCIRRKSENWDTR